MRIHTAASPPSKPAMVRSVSSGMTAAELEQARQFRKTALKGANGASPSYVSPPRYIFTYPSITEIDLTAIARTSAAVAPAQPIASLN